MFKCSLSLGLIMLKIRVEHEAEEGDPKLDNGDFH